MIRDNVLLYNNKIYNILTSQISQLILYDNSYYLFNITIDTSLNININTKINGISLFINKKSYFIDDTILDYYIEHNNNNKLTTTYIFKGMVLKDYTELSDDRFKFALHYKKSLLRNIKIKNLY